MAGWLTLLTGARSHPLNRAAIAGVLAVRDAQIAAPLGGGPAWTRPMAEARAAQAVALFYRLYAGR